MEEYPVEQTRNFEELSWLKAKFEETHLRTGVVINTRKWVMTNLMRFSQIMALRIPDSISSKCEIMALSELERLSSK